MNCSHIKSLTLNIFLKSSIKAQLRIMSAFINLVGDGPGTVQGNENFVYDHLSNPIYP